MKELPAKMGTLISAVVAVGCSFIGAGEWYAKERRITTNITVDELFTLTALVGDRKTERRKYDRSLVTLPYCTLLA